MLSSATNEVCLLFLKNGSLEKLNQPNFWKHFKDKPGKNKKKIHERKFSNLEILVYKVYKT